MGSPVLEQKGKHNINGDGGGDLVHMGCWDPFFLRKKLYFCLSKKMKNKQDVANDVLPPAGLNRRGGRHSHAYH
jgi:hypothetical protein